MSPPKVWGPAVWSLFHTLAEKVNANAYPHLARQMFNLIVRICRFLPCPECSTDAGNFLAKIKIENLKTKEDFKKTFYLFHNYVNAKKRSPMFNYINLNIYQRYRLIPIVNNFILCYNTKGNMKLLNESFQRQFVVKDFKNWFSANIRAFLPQFNPLSPVVSTAAPVEEEEHVIEQVVSNEEQQIVVQEEEQVVSNEEHQIVVQEEEPVVSNEEEPSVVLEQEQQIVVQEEEPVVSNEEQPVVLEEEHQIVVQEEEQAVSNEEHQIVVQEEEPVVSNEEQPVVLEEEQVVSTKSKKNKKKKN